ncbi:RNA polymerase sigma-70 factor [Pedobacter sp. MC2016-14]|uniref:RNA polymerase sigma factor n=1 Tax=Pedobacter sp. MC2016-14 TaxID=2897327 RepID=UPI001E4ED056|nr:RNA polymerase sigma-70 factor [Pedobacter sp. MC2016-14]MCD0489174.1 RNA polymerase sigma-70 factor [Pedobacter sp. MC2016-14]
MENRVLAEEDVLLANLAVGDERAFRLLFDFYRNVVYTYAMRYLKDRELAEEIVQEVFLKIWTGRGNLNTIGNFGAYLRVITRNLTLDVLKKKAAEFNKTQKSQVSWTEADDSTEQLILMKDSLSYIEQFIEKLPQQQRLVFKMCHIDGLKQKEVAEQLGISPLTVKVHLREAVKSLKMLVGDKNSLGLMVFAFVGLLK